MKKLLLLGTLAIFLLSGCNTAEAPSVSTSEQTSASATAAPQSDETTPQSDETTPQSDETTPQSDETTPQSNAETTVSTSSVKPNPGRAAQKIIIDGEIYREVYAWSSLLLVRSDDGYDVVQSNNVNAKELVENALKQDSRIGVTVPVGGQQPQCELEISTYYPEEIYRVDESLVIFVAQIEEFSAEGLSDDVIQRIGGEDVYYGRYFTTIKDTEGFESAYPNVAD